MNNNSEHHLSEKESASWICPKCGRENTGNFCSFCGAPHSAEEISQSSAPSEQKETPSSRKKNHHSHRRKHSLFSHSHKKRKRDHSDGNSRSKDTSRKKHHFFAILIGIAVIVICAVLVTVLLKRKQDTDHAGSAYTSYSMFDSKVSADIPNTLTADTEQSDADAYLYSSDSISLQVHFEMHSIDGVSGDSADNAADTFIDSLDSSFSIKNRETENINGVSSEVLSGTINESDGTVYSTEMAVMTLHNRILYVYCTWPSAEKTDYEDTADYIIESVKIDSSITIDGAAKTVTAIAATYDGAETSGTVLDSSNTGIHVTASYTDGTISDDLTGWAVKESKTLSAGRPATITITYEDTYTCELTVSCSDTDSSAYKDACSSIAYDDLLQDPDTYANQNIKIAGQVTDISESAEGTVLRIATKKNSSSDEYTDDIFYVTYNDETSIQKGSTVTLYGVYTGLYTDGDTAVPSMEALYIE